MKMVHLLMITTKLCTDFVQNWNSCCKLIWKVGVLLIHFWWVFIVLHTLKKWLLNVSEKIYMLWHCGLMLQIYCLLIQIMKIIFSLKASFCDQYRIKVFFLIYRILYTLLKFICKFLMNVLVQVWFHVLLPFQTGNWYLHSNLQTRSQ